MGFYGGAIISGINFALPKGLEDKEVSVIEVGPYIENGLAAELNEQFGTDIKGVTRTNQYILVHSKGVKGIEQLLDGVPFVDPVMHSAALGKSTWWERFRLKAAGKPLVPRFKLPYKHVLQSMYNPGTSDAEGDTALKQALLKLGLEPAEGDQGFLSTQYFIDGKLSKGEREEISSFLANPDLNVRQKLPKWRYLLGKTIMAPIVTLPPEIRIDEYDVANMDDVQLLDLSKKRKLAANLDEMKHFAAQYKDAAFLEERKKRGLSSKATDVELETWFSLRSEHCFHKEFNAHITLDDKVNDSVFEMAHRKGWLEKNEKGEYVLEKGMFKTFVNEPAKKIYDLLESRGKNWIASMFKDNSGVVFYDEDYMFCIKWETHNSPSMKEPVQGAKTGIGGVNRDIFGTMLGTFEAIANFFFYCTGHPAYKGWLPKGVKKAYSLLKGVTRGVREGGNESQIATEGGGNYTDPRYMAAKCLIYCGTVGFSPVRSKDGKNFLEKHAKPGDYVIVVGQPVGVDGVHGATESSMAAGAHISLGHVQADFSLIQAKAKEYILDVARGGLLEDITDMGAAGLASASHEIAQATGGLDMDLEKHPVKYNGVQPWQKNVAETQDRMLIVVKQENLEEVLKRAKIHDVMVTPVGNLTDSGYVDLKYGDRPAGLLDIKKLFNKEPRKRMHATWKGGDEKPATLEAMNVTLDEMAWSYTLQDSLALVMSQPDIACKEWFFRQKDSSVKGGTIQGPLIGKRQEVEADATIQKPIETEGRDFGAIAYSWGCAPKLSDIDPYLSAQRSFIDMVGKIIAIGGALPDMKNPKWDAWAVCGNYCQPNSDANETLTREAGEHNLASLVREGIGVREAIEELFIPVISGKDSMKCSGVYDVPNDFTLDMVPADLRKHILIKEYDAKVTKKNIFGFTKTMIVKKRRIEIHDPDSYIASAAVKIDDYRKCVSSSLKEEEGLIYVVGTTKNHLGASQLLSAVGYREQGKPIEGGTGPKTDFEEFVKSANAIHGAVDSRLVSSCSYIHNGGIAAALAKACWAGDKGADITMESIVQDGSCKSDLELLYSETPGRFIVTIAAKDKEKFEHLMQGTAASMIGKVTAGNYLALHGIGSSSECIDLDYVKKKWKEPLDLREART